MRGMVKSLEQFIEQKKNEFEAYGQKVQAAFEQKDRQEQELRAELDASEGKMLSALEEKDAEISVLNNQLEALRRDVASLQRKLTAARFDAGNGLVNVGCDIRQSQAIAQHLQDHQEGRADEPRPVILRQVQACEGRNETLERILQDRQANGR